MIEKLLEIRRDLKERKPEFIRQDTHKRKRLSIKWRRPKGIHSKIRHHFKGRRKMPSPGYKSPLEVRWLHSSGLKIINVYSVEDIKKIKKENEGIVIAKNVGLKNKFEILKKAKELNIIVLNLNVDEQIKKIEDLIASKKKTIKEEKKEEVKKEETKAEPKEKRGLSDEKRKETMRKEKDKILTKRI